jgi:hypothetical protein
MKFLLNQNNHLKSGLITERTGNSMYTWYLFLKWEISFGYCAVSGMKSLSSEINLSRASSMGSKKRKIKE